MSGATSGGIATRCEEAGLFDDRCPIAAKATGSTTAAHARPRRKREILTGRSYKGRSNLFRTAAVDRINTMLRQVLPRVGYAAVGLLYVTVGFVAARIAFLGSRDRVAGMHGALRVLLNQMEGVWIVAAMAAGLLAFAVWRCIQTFSARRVNFLTRTGWFIAAVGYGALAITAVRLLLRARGGFPVRRAGLDWVLASPVGRIALQVAGIILIVAGLVALVQGVSGRLPGWLASAGRGRTRTAALRLARIGLSARGIVGALMGFLLLRAVADHDPFEVVEIGGSLREISHQSPMGPLLMGVVAVGLFFYGIAIWTVAASRRPA